MHQGRVAFVFTERTGGVSQAPYASLNLGTHVGDDPAAVAENRRRVLAALGCEEDLLRLLVPNQVHGSKIVTLASAEEDELARVRQEIEAGCDGIVCAAPHVPVMLCFADCVPVVLTGAAGFAVAHSGWKGTYARIAAKAAAALARATGESPAGFHAYIGPHICADEYEVSEELMQKFADEFGPLGTYGPRLLDLGRAIRMALVEAGVPEESISDPQLSTIKQNDRYFSYRAENGRTGRHAAVAVLQP